MTSSIGITAAAAFLPAQVLSTAQVQAHISGGAGLALPAGLLEQLTGIRSRRMARDDEYASTLAIGAARQVLGSAGLGPLDFDVRVFAWASRDVAEPATAHIVQAELGSRA